MGVIREPTCVLRSDSSELAERAAEVLQAAGIPGSIRAELAPDAELDEEAEPLDEHFSYVVLVASDSTSAALEALACAGLPGRLELEPSREKRWVVAYHRFLAYLVVLFFIGITVFFIYDMFL